LEPTLSWNPGDVAEVARLMDQLMTSLSQRRREILELTYFDGLTAEEIAIKLDESVNVVRHELYRSLAKLRTAVLQENQTCAERKLSPGKGALRADA